VKEKNEIGLRGQNGRQCQSRGMAREREREREKVNERERRVV
jgi:hypothetical protein